MDELGLMFDVLKYGHSATTNPITQILNFTDGEMCKKSSREILSVALLSPACCELCWAKYYKTVELRMYLSVRISVIES